MCIACIGGEGVQGFSAAANAAVAHHLTETQIEDGRAFLSRHPSVDIHAHPARFFMAGAGASAEFASRYAPMSLSQSIEDMQAGGVAAVMIATVADLPLLGMESRGLRACREFEAGEALSTH